jgi:prepilin-type N-terminal cleavage/methylation domain-containing protein/prepilin-type processing-associated H-X9-DG protein
MARALLNQVSSGWVANMMKSPRRRSAFTLVELLVVVGVIAVLVAILLPALNAAREQAKLVMCLSNIRQCAMTAVGMYAADHGGAIPPLIAPNKDLPYAGYASWGGGGCSLVMSPPIGGYGWPGTAAGWPDLLQRYLSPGMQRDNPSFHEYSPVLYCAADYFNMTGPGTSGYDRGGWWGNLYFREFSWRANVNITPVAFDASCDPWYGRGVYGMKFASVRSSSRKILFAEAHYQNVNGAVWGSVAIDGIGQMLTPYLVHLYSAPERDSVPRHRNGCVVAYCDGHASIVNWDERNRLMQMQPQDWDLHY